MQELLFSNKVKQTKLISKNKTQMGQWKKGKKKKA